MNWSLGRLVSEFQASQGDLSRASSRTRGNKRAQFRSPSGRQAGSADAPRRMRYALMTESAGEGFRSVPHACKQSLRRLREVGNQVRALGRFANTAVRHSICGDELLRLSEELI